MTKASDYIKTDPGALRQYEAQQTVLWLLAALFRGRIEGFAIRRRDKTYTVEINR